MKFKCPSCSTTLSVEAEMAGKMVRCPACDTKLQIPEFTPPPSAPADGVPDPTGVSNAWDSEKQHQQVAGAETPAGASSDYSKPHRTGWVETDPVNPNMLLSVIYGTVATAAWYGALFPLGKGAYGSPPSNALDYIHDLFYERTWVNYMETWFFFWALAMLFLKWQKLRRQHNALYIDILPAEISQEINKDNVDQFIDRLYGFPTRLRDSMMINRMRKALELFEVRANNGEVSNMLNAQSNIDGARIGGSYALIKVFLWAIPILGFIGTVLGLSQAIGSMDLSNAADVEKIMSSISKVTSGLGTAFDTTLLGLVLAMFLNFPMSTLAKAEDDNLNDIDAYCNEVLLPRLNDGAGSELSSMFGGGETGAFVENLAKALTAAQQEMLTDLRAVTEKIREQATNLDKRADSHAAQVAAEFSKSMAQMRETHNHNMSESVQKTTDYIRTLASGLQGLNSVLKELGEKQVVIQQVRKRGWFGN